jgi:hypothetical protein
MKPLPAPPVPGNTEWERFDNSAPNYTIRRAATQGVATTRQSA